VLVAGVSGFGAELGRSFRGRAGAGNGVLARILTVVGRAVELSNGLLQLPRLSGAVCDRR